MQVVNRIDYDTIFRFEETYCLCVGGVPNRPEGTVIQGLGSLPEQIPPRVEVINDPSMGLGVCVMALVALLSKLV